MKKVSIILMALIMVFALAACNDSGGTTPSPSPSDGGATGGIDGMTTASNETNLYDNYDEAALAAAIQRYAGTCMFATTNEDGSPRVAIFVPGYVDGHIYFGWAENESKANFLREKRAEMIYYVKDTEADSSDKKRHKGARVVLTLVEDEETLEALKAQVPEASQEHFSSAVVCKIEAVLPLG
ncbi:hypothetical protein LJC55_02930 [Eubacteriales bacterium OttesenSCG-928-N14]|nr:hypothetical protein [Eubacteriales bacterium OttesenSCG-928-N14]